MPKPRKSTRQDERKAEKQRQRRALRDQRRDEWNRRSRIPMNALPADARIMELTIDDGPADIPEFDALPEKLRTEIEPFLSYELEDYSEWIPQLEDWINRGADVPQLYNRLTAGYAQAGRDDEYNTMIRRTYERFPDYIFGKIGYAEQRLKAGFPDEVRDILGGSLALDEIAGRTTLHSSEVRGWGLLMVRYLLAAGKLDEAASTFEFVKSVSPDHPLTDTLEKMIERATLLDTIRVVEELISGQDRLLRFDP